MKCEVVDAHPPILVSPAQIPASKKRLDATAPKFDTHLEEADPALPIGSLTGADAHLPHPTFVSSSNDSDLFRGTLYPDAAISEYLPRCKVWMFHTVWIFFPFKTPALE